MNIQYTLMFLPFSLMSHFLALFISRLVEILTGEWGLSQQLRVPATTRMQVCIYICIKTKNCVVKCIYIVPVQVHVHVCMYVLYMYTMSCTMYMYVHMYNVRVCTDSNVHCTCIYLYLYKHNIIHVYTHLYVQRLHNMDVALSCLKRHMPVSEKLAEALVDGHCEKTLALLWSIIFHFKVHVTCTLFVHVHVAIHSEYNNMMQWFFLKYFSGGANQYFEK